MQNALVGIVLVIGIINLIILIILVTRRGGAGLDSALRAEFAQQRREFAASSKDLRSEVNQGMFQSREALDKQMELMRHTVEVRLESLQKDNAEKLEKCAPPSMKSCNRLWKNGSANHSRWSATDWSRSTKDWVKCPI